MNTLTHTTTETMNTPTAAQPQLGPLATCNLDDANWKLRQGHASEENALAYVTMWNRPGMRGTVARLDFYTVPLGSAALRVPEIRIS